MRKRAGLLAGLLVLTLGSGAVAQEPSPEATSSFAPDDLAAILPTQVGPVTLDIQSFDGPEQVAEDPEKYEDVFLRLGKDASDYSLATARGEAEAGSSVVYVAAFRIEGVYADDWGFDEVLTFDLDDPPPDRHVQWQDIGDRRVAVISHDAQEAGWSAVYAKGEVFFFLVGGGGVTIEDVLEEIVGDIQDEHDHEEALVHREAEGCWAINAAAHVDELTELFDIEFEDRDFDTVGGLIVSNLGRVPALGEVLRIGGLQFEVLESDQRRICQVRVRRDESVEAGGDQ